jgi:hypothetical protein
MSLVIDSLSTWNAGALAQLDDEIQRLLCLPLGKFGKLLRCRRVDQRAFAVVADRVLRFGIERRDAGTGFLGEETARRAVSLESSEPSVGTRMCLNMAPPPLLSDQTIGMKGAQS